MENKVPVINPSGELVTLPKEVLAGAVNEGYRPATPQDIEQFQAKEKYGTTGQQVIGGIEQVAKGALGPIAPAVERAFGVPAKDIRGREEQKGAGEKFLEQGLGLVGGGYLLPGGGQAGVLERLGAGATEGMAAQTGMQKIGTAAAKMAVENATYQGGDELAKAIVHDPSQSVGSAITDIGLATLIGGVGGGAVGAVSPLWQATAGPKVESLLRLVSNKANGEALPISKDLKSVFTSLEKDGHTIAPEIKAGLSDLPEANNYFQTLVESGTGTGDAIRQTLEKFQGDIQNHLEGIFKAEGEMTGFQAGEKAKDIISSKIDDLHDIISKKYSSVMPQLETAALDPALKKEAAAKILEMGENFGEKNGPYKSIFENNAESVLTQENASQLKKIISRLGSEWEVARRAGDFEKARALSDVRSFIKSTMNRQLAKAGESLGITGLEAELAAADKLYSQFVEKVSDIASVGKLGKARTHGQLMEALDKVPSAKLAEKLFDKKNIEGLRMLKEEYPEVFDTLVKAKKTSILEAASKTGDLHHNKILNAVNSLPKEVQELIFKPDELKMINASGKILRQSFKRINPSGTGRTIDKLREHMMGGLGAVIGTVMGHGPMGGLVVGELAQLLGRNAPDAAKMALLKFLGSSEPLSGTAFKAIHDYAAHMVQGQKLIMKATSAAIKAGTEVLPKSKIPTDKEREKFNKNLKELQEGKYGLIDMGKDLNHYAPEHVAAMAGVSMRAVQYLNSIRPEPKKQMTFDSNNKPTKASEYEFNQALNIAMQPLLVCKSIQNGTLTQKEMTHLQALHPEVYSQMSSQFMAHLTDHELDQSQVKYKQRLSLAVFLGEPLDSTMTPSAIHSAQVAMVNDVAQTQEQKMPAPTEKGVQKLAQGIATPGQAREMARATRT